MRQIVIPRFGPPDVFEMRERPDPSPGDGELRIRVRAIGVNFADVLARMGLYPDAPKPPLVVGYEVSGHVEAMGRAVVGFAEGDRVVAMTRFGGYADTVVVPSNQAFHFPEALSDSEAAAVPVNFLTAALALYRLAALAPGETVLIQNAGGGVGTAATQLARLRRAKVDRYGVRLQARCVTYVRGRSCDRLPPCERGRRGEEDHARAGRRRHPGSDWRAELRRRAIGCSLPSAGW